MFALEYFPMVAGCRRFINGDLIAAGLSPLAPKPFTGCQPLVLAVVLPRVRILLLKQRLPDEVILSLWNG
jgi:hypothetical protein